MNDIWNWKFWLEPLQSVGTEFAHSAPKLLAAFLLLLMGLFLAWVVQHLAGKLFKWSKLDEKFSGLWIFRLWSQGMHGHSLSRTAANFMYYLMLFGTVLVAIRLLGVGMEETVLNPLLGLIPRIFTFMLILFVGGLMAMFFSVVAQLVLAGTNLQYPHFWGKVVAWGTFGVAAVFSLEQLGIVGQLVTWLVLIFLAALALAAALAFGLGCKDLAKEFLIEERNRQNPGA